MVDLVISVIGDDKPGIVEEIADCIEQHDASWAESHLSHMAGKFAGTIRVHVPNEQAANLSLALRTGIERAEVRVDQVNDAQHNDSSHVDILVTCNDRPGIVREISTVLANEQVNVVEMFTDHEPAPHSGDILFVARLGLSLPDSVDNDRLFEVLEELSDDVMVDFFEAE